jgi:hypothetical protein
MWKALGRWLSKWVVKSGVLEAAAEAVIKDKLGSKVAEPSKEQE